MRDAGRTAKLLPGSRAEIGTGLWPSSGSCDWTTAELVAHIYPAGAYGSALATFMLNWRLPLLTEYIRSFVLRTTVARLTEPFSSSC